MASSSISSSSGPYAIRASTPTDMPAINAILTENDFFTDSVLGTGKGCYVVLYQSFIVGVLVWQPLPHGAGKEACTLAVLKSYQGHGVGKALMNHIKEKCRGKRVKVIPKMGLDDYYRKQGYVSDSDDMWALRIKPKTR